MKNWLSGLQNVLRILYITRMVLKKTLIFVISIVSSIELSLLAMELWKKLFPWYSKGEKAYKKVKPRNVYKLNLRESSKWRLITIITKSVQKSSDMLFDQKWPIFSHGIKWARIIDDGARRTLSIMKISNRFTPTASNAVERHFFDDRWKNGKRCF
jgi:hypothetical protein